MGLSMLLYFILHQQQILLSLAWNICVDRLSFVFLGDCSMCVIVIETGGNLASSLFGLWLLYLVICSLLTDINL